MVQLQNPSVAEAVYEGMDEIPGCDPEIVQALTRSNQAYDVMRNYSETNNADLFFEAADILGRSHEPDVWIHCHIYGVTVIQADRYWISPLLRLRHDNVL